MAFIQRTLRLVGLVALFTIIIATQAQAEVTVVGSALVQPVLQDVAAFGEVDIDFDLQTTGTRNGFAQFCAGEADIQTASRAITLDEETACVENEIDYAEFIIGYDILAFIANPDDGFLTCLTNADINAIFAPSAATDLTNWSSLNPDTLAEDEEPPFPELDITVRLPQADTLTYLTLDNIVNGIGLRDDAELTDVETIIETISTTEGAIGVVPLQALDNAPADVEVLSINFDDLESGCTAPSASNVDNRLYPAATPLYVYVNRAQTEALAAFLEILLSEEAGEPVAATGFSPVSAAGNDLNGQILRGEISGRQPSDSEEAFTIPAVLTGEITIGGTSFMYNFVNTVANALAGSQEGFTVTVDTLGEAAARADLCAGEIDMAFTSGTITCDDDTAIVSIPMGAQAVVLLGNLEDEYTTCLTTAQINTIWGAPATETITNWGDLGEPLPDQNMTLFGVREGNLLTELLLRSSEGAPLPVRLDTEIDFDPLYRAAATANVSGALTYLSWNDYQQVVANEQANIQLVSVDGGNGCVVPGEETMADGTYPLASPVTLNITQSALADVNVQSMAWSIFSDDNHRLLESNHIVGIDFGALPAIRDTLAVEFNIAATAAQAAAEATAEPDAEATDEAAETDGSSGEAEATDDAEATETTED